ncbi:MAG TPA: tRNA pseudouridine(38-40) synthase TruA [Longimicrobiales bacterium]
MTGRADAAEHRFRLTLHYDGSGFAGWQVQPGERTVQGELEAALDRLTGQTARVIAAGRTDAGVHATGQVVGIPIPAKWSPEELRRALNAVLPRDVWVAAAATAPPGFHARYDAVARGYVYRLGTADVARSPFVRRWCWPLGQPVSLAALNDAAARFHGEHSFRAFAKSGQPERGEQCNVLRAEWRAAPHATITFHVAANRFLHHMVRYMVGTMVDVARERRAAADIDGLLRGDPGVETSPPAPPEGLYLTRVYYENDDLDAADEIFP